MPTKTLAQYRKNVRVKHGTRITVAAKEYVNAHTAIAHLCECGNRWDTPPNRVLSSTTHGCPACRHARSAQARTLTDQEIRKRMHAVHGNAIKLVGQYRGMMVKHRFKCYKCLGTWKAALNNVLHKASSCPSCAGEVKKRNGYKTARIKEYTRNGVTLRLQGYEPLALDWIFQRFPKLRMKDLVVDTSGDVPVVRYATGRRHRNYYPDIFIPSQNRIVEVKSTYTLGLLTGRAWKRNQSKAKACLDAGYKFTMLVMQPDGSRLLLPKEWHCMTRARVQELLSRHT